MKLMVLMSILVVSCMNKQQDYIIKEKYLDGWGYFNSTGTNYATGYLKVGITRDEFLKVITDSVVSNDLEDPAYFVSMVADFYGELFLLIKNEPVEDQYQRMMLMLKKLETKNNVDSPNEKVGFGEEGKIPNQKTILPREVKSSSEP